MKKHQKTIFMALILSEGTHVFCCVLPTLFSVFSLLAGLGMVSALPVGFLRFHDFLHKWELPMIAFSGLVLAAGWWLYGQSKKIDCHDSGCHHGPCGPQKDRTGFIMKAATVLFAVNILVYAVLHRGLDIGMPVTAAHHDAHEHDDGDSH